MIALPFHLLFIGSMDVSGEGRFFDVLGAALRGGADAFLLREKRMDGGPMFRLAVEGRHMTRVAGTLFLVSDRIDVALASGADGVHLPENSFTTEEARRLVRPGMLVGRSVHDEACAKLAEERGTDYILVGPVFETPGKERFALGVERAAAIADSVSIPSVAVGGIDGTNIAEVAARFPAAAVIRAIAAAPDPARAAAELRAPFGEGR